MGSQCSIGPILRNMGRFYYLLCMADVMVGRTQTIDIHYTDRQGLARCYSILFTMSIHPGMVGEEHISYQAYQVTYDDPSPVVRPQALHYRALRGIYNKMEGKEKRLQYWAWLVEMSPEAELRRDEELLADIHNRIV